MVIRQEVVTQAAKTSDFATSAGPSPVDRLLAATIVSCPTMDSGMTARAAERQHRTMTSSETLHYRLFVEVDDAHATVQKKAVEQLHSWLRGKGYNADALTDDGTENQLATRVTGSMAVTDRRDKSRSIRAVISEDNGPRGRWTTLLTVNVPRQGRGKPWLWLDVKGPDNMNGAVPKLARGLLDVFDARTDGVRLGDAHPVTETIEVGDLVDALCAPTRRGLVFIAGSDGHLPFEQWLRHVRELLRNCVGLAGAYVLDPDATREFNNAIGPAHRVEPWTVRTFHPGVEPDDAVDGRRHKILGRERIINDSVQRIAKTLAHRAKEVALETPLPSAAVHVDQAFGRLIDDALLAPLATTPSEKHRAPAPIDSDPLMDALGLLLGGGPVTPERVLDLADVVDLGRETSRRRAAISDRLAEYETVLSQLRQENMDIKLRLDDAQLEYAIADDERFKTAERVRWLETQLAEKGRADQLWPVDGKQEPERPADCAQLADMLDSFVRIQFTGHADHLRELDDHDGTGVWAGKFWDALGALDDYADAVHRAEFDGDVRVYLEKTPPGRRGFSINKFAPVESDTVRSTPRFSQARMFPVPMAVDPRRSIFMEAHFKIARAGTISPRLHFHNDVRGTGLVYVGYMGKHLPNTRTN